MATAHRVAVATAILLAAGVGDALADSCSYSAAQKRVNVSVTGAGEIRIIRSGQAIIAVSGSTPLACGAATVTNTDRVVVSGTGSSADVYSANYLEIDESQGRLAPGATGEADGHPEIEVRFNVTPGTNLNGAPNTLTAGADGDTLRGLRGDDLLRARDGEIDSVDGGDGSDTGEVDLGDAVVNVEAFQ